MNPRTELRLYLKSVPQINSIVGDRIYTLHRQTLDNQKYPCIVISRVGNSRTMTHGGHAGISKPKFQISCFGKDKDTVDILADYVIDATDGYSGLMSGLRVDSCFHLNDIESYEPETQIYHVPIDIEINHKS